MRTPFLFIALGLMPLCTRAQVALPHAQLAAHMKAMTDASSDTLRDSLSTVIKRELRGFLEADDALTASFTDVPMSHVDAPDGRFRFFTWNVPHEDGTHLFEGMLLVREKNRRVLFELRDMTPKIPNPNSAVLGPKDWYGALYYHVIPVEKGGRTYYTLLGWKGFSNVETHKVIEVLSFKGSTPVFGAPFFGEGKNKHAREIFAFGFEASMSLKWDPKNEGIVFDHLSPTRQDLKGQPAFTAPDFTFDALVWYHNRWALVPDVDVRDPNAPKKFKAAPPRKQPPNALPSGQ